MLTDESRLERWVLVNDHVLSEDSTKFVCITFPRTRLRHIQHINPSRYLPRFIVHCRLVLFGNIDHIAKSNQVKSSQVV